MPLRKDEQVVVVKKDINEKLMIIKSRDGLPVRFSVEKALREYLHKYYPELSEDKGDDIQK